MKKFVFLLIAIGVIGALGAGFYLYSNQIAIISEKEVVEDIDSETNEEIDLINSIIENTEQDSLEELPEDLSDIPEEISNSKKRLPVMSSIKSAKLYENAFIRFSHPGYITFKNETLTFLEIWNDDVLIGTINLYSNPEGLEIKEFVKKDNLIDYFTESMAKGLNFEEFEIPTAVKAFKFTDYPELQPGDVYLIEFANLIIVSKDFSEDDVVGEYLLKSLEKTQ
jgi:hypothetical protein